MNEEVLDAVGELVNIIAGGAKAKLEQHKLELSLPNVVTGLSYDIHFPSQVKPLLIGFSCDWGEVVVEIGFSNME